MLISNSHCYLYVSYCCTGFPASLLNNLPSISQTHMFNKQNKDRTSTNKQTNVFGGTKETSISRASAEQKNLTMPYYAGKYSTLWKCPGARCHPHIVTICPLSSDHVSFSISIQSIRKIKSEFPRAFSLATSLHYLMISIFLNSKFINLELSTASSSWHLNSPPPQVRVEYLQTPVCAF